MKTFTSVFILLAIALIHGNSAAMANNLPAFADTHLHYNADQAESIDVDEAIRRLKQNNVVFGIVSSRPPEMALALSDASGGWIIPFFMPYLEAERKRDWVFDDRVLPAARKALASGKYKGLGEMHLFPGYAPPLKERHEVIDGMLDLALEFDVPAIVHAEASSHLYFKPLCQRHPQAKIVWVHAGSPLPPAEVRKLLEACPNVHIDLSARDHMRYGQTEPIVNDKGYLLPEWKQLVLDYQDKIMLGSDPFYYETDTTWLAPNTGWNYVTEVLDFHRQWLSELPEDVRHKLVLGNAMKYYGLTPGDLRQD
jgi:hypothetical protein